ncbi:ferrochelatase [Nocardioides sp. R-C-SC26]|uniref:ferrochelatase n=1 Tax=Nocardioides sp. R-C-SC26 TaxID=2870414 RepID=UPI0035AB808A
MPDHAANHEVGPGSPRDAVHQSTTDVAPYDAVLLVSFGGPEAPEDVVPFLENVTRGRGIPRERLEAVGEHYFLFGGRSPINDQNRALLAEIQADLAGHGIDLPVYWGNRNWAPYLDDVVAEMAADGVRRAACFVTSAYSSWSSCRQYRENLYDAVARVPENAPELDKLRVYYDHPGFLEPVVDAVGAALDELPADLRDEARLVFVTHSIPWSMSSTSGPPPHRDVDQDADPDAVGGRYVAQHREASAWVSEQVRVRRGATLEHDLVYCSRSGAPHIPWLEPDVNDHLEALGAAGCRAVVLVPIGFVSDHMEVVYDLDTEALATAEQLGIAAVRAATPGIDPRFVAMVRELLLERAAAERGQQPDRPAIGGIGPGWDRCPVGCCANPRADRPALAGESEEVPAGTGERA